jgi:hypothetical protein
VFIELAAIRYVTSGMDAVAPFPERYSRSRGLFRSHIRLFLEFSPDDLKVSQAR